MASIASIFVNDPAKAGQKVGKTEQELTDFNKKFSLMVIQMVLLMVKLLKV